MRVVDGTLVLGAFVLGALAAGCSLGVSGLAEDPWSGDAGIATATGGQGGGSAPDASPILSSSDAGASDDDGDVGSDAEMDPDVAVDAAPTGPSGPPTPPKPGGDGGGGKPKKP